ncbi:PKD domain-containing protein [Endothiovibrio diazotrophicus]
MTHAHSFVAGNDTYLTFNNRYDDSSYNVTSTIFRRDGNQFAADATTGTTPFTVTVDASGSTDPDGGAITDYQWMTSDIQSTSGPAATFTFTAAGRYLIALTVTDDQGETGEYSITVHAEDPIATEPTGCEGRAVYSAADGTLQLP